MIIPLLRLSLLERDAAAFNLVGHLLHQPAHDLVGHYSLVRAPDAEGQFQIRVLVWDKRYQASRTGKVGHRGIGVGRSRPSLAQFHGPGIVGTGTPNLRMCSR